MKKETKKATELVAKFNELFPVGATILFRSVAVRNSTYSPYKVTAAAFIASCGEPVAFLEGRSGYVSIDPDFVNYEGSLNYQACRQPSTTQENPAPASA